MLIQFNLADIDKIVRSRDLAVLQKCEYVCDVGGIYDPSKKLFDHHQSQYTGHWSSAGMVLDFLRQQKILTDEIYRYFNHSLVQGVDAHDNGRDPQVPGFCSFSNVVSNFTPIDHEATPESQDMAFMEALNFVHGHIKRLYDRFNYIQSCRSKVADVMAQDKDCLIFDKGLPWLEAFFELDGVNHPASFIIMPSGSHWKLRGIPPSYEQRMKVRLPLPQEWAGLLDDELKKVSGIAGAIFCHKGRFISVWKTKQDAILALKEVLRKAKEGRR